MPTLADLNLTPDQLTLTDEEFGMILSNHLNSYPLRDKLDTIVEQVTHPAVQKLVLEFCIAYCIYLGLMPKHLIDGRNRSATLVAKAMLDAVPEKTLTYEMERTIHSRCA